MTKQPSDTMQLSTTYMRVLAREHSDPQGLLRKLEISEDTASDSEMTPISNFFELVRTIEASHSDRAWHLEFSRKTVDHFHGPLTFVMMTAPTIGDGVEAFARYLQTRAPYLSGTTHREGNECVIEFEELRDLEDIRHILVEIPFRVLHDYMAMIGDVNLAAATLSLRYPESDERQYYDRGFDCGVLLGQQKNTLAIPAAWMTIQSPQYEESVWSNAVAQCEVTLSNLNPADTLARTRAYIKLTLDRDPQALCINDAAQSLGMSARTLIRRLGKSGDSFHDLRDEARKDLALQLLNKPNLTLEDISQILGFSDGASFSQAFRRWFGNPPGRYRRGKAE